jgi:non-heme chloroperoxidase
MLHMLNGRKDLSRQSSSEQFRIELSMVGVPLLKTVRVRNAELTYDERGSGGPVVFVHGSLADYSTWRNQIDPFSKHYRAIAYSRRYHYPNAWVGDGTDYSGDLHAEDLAELIVTLAGGKAHIVGSSYGSYTALVLAVRHPKLVRSLVLAEPPILPWLSESIEGERLRQEFMATAWEPAGEAFRSGNSELGVKLFLNGVIGSGTYEKLPEANRAALMNNAPEMKAETLSRRYFTPLTFDKIRGLKVPVLLLSGERSPRMFHLITAQLLRCLPEAPHLIIAGASHSMHSQNPDLYNSTVLDFLSKA